MTPGDPRGRGCNALLRAGAFPVESAEDVAAAVPLRTALARPRASAAAVHAPPEEAPLSDDASRVLEHVGGAPVDSDAVAASTGMSVSAVQAALLELEIAGRVVRDETGAYHIS